MRLKLERQIDFGDGKLVKIGTRKCPVTKCSGVLEARLQEVEGQVSKGGVAIFDLVAIETGGTQMTCPECGCLLYIPCTGGAEVEHYPVNSPS